MSNKFDQWKILIMALLAMELAVSSAGPNLDQSRKRLLQVLESKNFHIPIGNQDPPLMEKLLSLYKSSDESTNNTNGQNYTATGRDYAKSHLSILPYGLRLIKRALQGKKNGVHVAPYNEKYNRLLSEKNFHLRDVLREIRNGIQGNVEMENDVKNAADTGEISVKEIESKSDNNVTEGMSKNKRVAKNEDETDKNVSQENGNKSFINMSAVTSGEYVTVDGPVILIFVLSIEGSLILSFLGVMWCVIAYNSHHRKAFQEKFRSGRKEEEDEINLELFEYHAGKNLDRHSSNPSKSFKAVHQEERRRH